MVVVGLVGVEVVIRHGGCEIMSCYHERMKTIRAQGPRSSSRSRRRMSNSSSSSSSSSSRRSRNCISGSSRTSSRSSRSSTWGM